MNDVVKCNFYSQNTSGEPPAEARPEPDGSKNRSILAGNRKKETLAIASGNYVEIIVTKRWIYFWVWLEGPGGLFQEVGVQELP